ncbi:hypothetical protein BCR32DRAFT_288446 [Anaeromyces robustus]|uniref:Uncharacterized protein n=1 Tax=Anaeromyces robustus TaxID=1754192 RepID=A0A1Y1UV49_9FUNG|nr:hypothetical protein BCR32DRAFT_288446 [Anaeromyces robustus]|eukprot:ORX41830.1 hypothetical protein BCR32DRAFT_288446 [Anaeromyces robustus]
MYKNEKNYENQQKIKNNDPKYVKLILIELYEKMLSLNLEYAVLQDIDNKLWKIFYSEPNRRNSNRYIENNLWKFQNQLEKLLHIINC